MRVFKLYMLVLSIFISGLNYANKASEYTIIEGDFQGEVKSEEVILHHVVDGQLTPYTTTKIAESGKFGFVIPVVEPGFYYVDYGQMTLKNKDQLIRLYLEPGLDFSIDIDTYSYKLSGKKLGHNKLVQEANNIYNKFSKFIVFNGAISYEQFYPFIRNEGTQMVSEFKSSIDTKDNDFNDLLKLAVQADYENALYYFFRIPRTKFPKKGNELSAYETLYVDGIKFSDPNILKLENGVAWMENYFFYYTIKNKITKDRIKRISSCIAHISDDRIKEVYIRESIKKGYYKAYEYNAFITPLRQYLTSETSKEFIVEYEKNHHKDEGQAGYNFTYNDPKGNPVSFSEFKGKYVYIDLWATWCGPCKKEIPFLKELEEKYKDEAIEFVSISLDKPKNLQKWKDFVADKNLKGVQLVADNAFDSGIAKNYSVKSIPRFLLFDKEGKIISTNALRPSNPALNTQFQSLLKK
ncbi:TlpA family protein disulfide reductase [Joostella sp.]|uniref:TlpA family protein disulfide reductase n=1 Tax=Joostella sp. TaxID=2231138 RepID=UPI003A912023